MLRIPNVLHNVPISLGLAWAIWTACDCNAAIASEKVVYAFKGGSDGTAPYAGLISDDAGNFYGTTSAGGGGAGCQGNCGTIFKVTADGTESVLYAFQGGKDGAHPIASLIGDSAGNYYGTTAAGGVSPGWGTVFELSPSGTGWTETVLYAFLGGGDGRVPASGLIEDAQGNLYGTTDFGGNMAQCGGVGCGTVFRVTPDGIQSTETVLYAFCSQTNCSDGRDPLAGLIMDNQGNLYGTTSEGGTGNCSPFPGCGTVFEVTPDGTETVLYSFQGGSDGAIPEAGLIEDNNGNFYGTTAGGGGCAANGNCGTVFKLPPSNQETVLYAFKGGKNDGQLPLGGVIMDGAGNLYGTTNAGGGAKECRRTGCGIVFKLAPNGQETVLSAMGHGRYPAAGLLKRSHRLYGTASAGGAGNGVVFSVKK